MNAHDCLFWNVDTQSDFVSPRGKLYVPGAELLKTNWKSLTNFAKNKSITVVNTADWHFDESKELSTVPDFVTTFPPHCMAKTSGAEFIEETRPENSIVFEWNQEYRQLEMLVDTGKFRNYIIRKDAFDVFKGNRYTGRILELLSPKAVFVYGVTTNVCVNDAVVGLAKRTEQVYVFEDAIRELPNIPLPFENWKKLGVEMIKLDELEEFFRD